MKFSITFKTPDAGESVLSRYEKYTDEWYAIKKTLEKYLSYGEFITIEFDTDGKSPRVYE